MILPRPVHPVADLEVVGDAVSLPEHGSGKPQPVLSSEDDVDATVAVIDGRRVRSLADRSDRTTPSARVQNDAFVPDKLGPLDRVTQKQ